MLAAIAVCVAVAALVYAAAVGLIGHWRPILWGYAVGVTAAVVALGLRRTPAMGDYRPGRHEYAVAIWGLPFFPALAAGVGVVAFWVSQWLWSVAGVAWIWDWGLHSAVLVNLLRVLGGIVAALLALALAIAGLGTVALAASQMVRESSAGLYPKVAGVPPHYARLAQSVRPWVLAAAAVGFIGLFALLFVDGLPWVPYVFLAYTYLATAWPYSTSEAIPPGRVGEEMVAAVREAFKASNFEVTSYPRTANPEIDPFLTNIDLHAAADEQEFIVEVKRGVPPNGRVSWNQASSVLAAASVLSSAGGSRGRRIDPVLVIIDGVPDDSLVTLAKDEGLGLVVVSGPHRSVAGFDSRRDLEAVARELSRRLEARRAGNEPERGTG